MIRIGAAAVLAGLALLGCAASEGGVTGTGISASVSGNVSLISDSPSNPGSGDVPFPVRVTIEEIPDVEGTTDVQGAFELHGAFSGAVTLDFANALSGAALGTLALEVPAGSATVLENIEIHTAAPLPERVRPNAVRQLGVFGRVDVVECGDDGTGMVLLHDDGRPGRQFMLRLTPSTTISARNGMPLACDDLAPGMTVLVEGLLQLADRTIVALSVVASAAPVRGPPLGPRPEHLRGTVSDVACARRLIAVAQRGDGESARRLVQLTAATVVECPGQPSPSCRCEDIQIGDAISVGGTIDPSRPGVVTANHIAVSAGSVPVSVLAVIITTSCATGTLAAESVSDPLQVLLDAATLFVCRAGPCRCADLRPRDRVRIDGVRKPDQPGVITAEQLTVLPNRRTGRSP